MRGLKTKHYYPPAGKALPAVVLSIIARVGSVNGQRVALITEVVSADPDDPSEAALRTRVLHQTAKTLGEEEIPVFDAGFKIREPQAAQLPRYLVRLPVNPGLTGQDRLHRPPQRLTSLHRSWPPA